jgi:hypothetical protein
VKTRRVERRHKDEEGKRTIQVAAVAKKTSQAKHTIDSTEHRERSGH